MADHGSGAAPRLADDQLLRARCAAQLLHRPDPPLAPPDLVGRLLAVQAQDPPAAGLALRARGRGLAAADVAAARLARSIVRTWGPRGTLHLVAAD
ncbi:MAG: DNA glycosylase AlkZ-like family protein, partial [Streptomycetales bacterium]